MSQDISEQDIELFFYTDKDFWEGLELAISNLGCPEYNIPPCIFCQLYETTVQDEMGRREKTQDCVNCDYAFEMGRCVIETRLPSTWQILHLYVLEKRYEDTIHHLEQIVEKIKQIIINIRREEKLADLFFRAFNIKKNKE